MSGKAKGRASSSRRLACSLGLLTVAVVAVSDPVSATSQVQTYRYQGADRYATAAALAVGTFPGGVPTAVVARGDAFPDALSATNLLGKGRVPGAILLTTFAALPTSTVDALRRLGTTSVFIVGDTSVVSTRVEQQLVDMGIRVERIGGRDRYETAESASYRYFNIEAEHPASVDGKRTGLLVSGTAYADGMSAGALTYAEELPLFLTDPQHLPYRTKVALTNAGLSLDQVFIVGGTGAVSDTVADEVRALGIEVHRIAGTNRQATSVALAEFEQQKFGWVFNHVNLARGDAFPDAIAGAPHAGEEKEPTLLTQDANTLGSDTRAEVQRHAATVATIHAYGDVTAISAAVLDQARQAATR